jgi:hypothetical protein
MTKSINILHLKSISWDYILIIELENGFYATLTLYSEELVYIYLKRATIIRLLLKVINNKIHNEISLTLIMIQIK